MDNTNELNTAQSGLLSFDPSVLIQDVAKRWLLIILVAAIVGVGTYIKTDSDYKPVYQSTTTFVVTTHSSSSTVYSNLSSTTTLASMFTDLLNSSILRKTILAEIGATSFDGNIDARVVAETNLLTVNVTASDPRTAFMVSQAIIDHHESLTYQVVDGIALEVLQNPKVPVAPMNYADASGQMKRMMVFAAAAAVAAIAAISYFRDAVRSSKEAKAKLDCELLGEIPHEVKYKTLAARLRHKKTSVLITSPVTSFRFVENIRKLRQRVEHHMKDDRVLMVTSLLENEGKSTVAVNLALSMAQKYEKVLLIDCDLRKPACYAVMGKLPVEIGLRGVLADRSKFDKALIRDKKSGLYMLLEKRGNRNSGDLIASREMYELICRAREEFDFVVLDLPPMAKVSDAESMMDLADASLLVVRQNEAVAPMLNKTIATLESGRAKLLGCVLNNVHATALSSGQGYGYGYGGYGKYGKYGHYGRYDKSNSDKKES